MLIFNLLGKFASKNKLESILTLSLCIPLIIILANHNVTSYSESAIGILLAGIALYIGTFTAFLGLLFGLIVSPLSALVERESYRIRLICLKETVRTTTLSVVLVLISIPIVILSHEKVKLNLDDFGIIPGLTSATYVTIIKPAIFYTSILLLSFVFCLTYMILRQMNSLAMVAISEKWVSVMAMHAPPPKEVEIPKVEAQP